MPANVKCSVSDCTYWDSGNQCNADLIMVEIDQHAKKTFHAEFAAEFGYDTEHQDHAEKASATCCHTYKPKGK